MDKELIKYKNDIDFKNWYKIVKPIITSEEFKKRKLMKHHDDSVYEHCVAVSFYSYKMAAKRKRDEFFCYNCSIAGLLHDFYPRAWQYSESLNLLDSSYSARFNDKKNNRDLHGFTHAKDALINARKFYKEFLTPQIEDAILKHMFPINPYPPKYIEGWYITLADKFVSFKNFPSLKELPKYVGINVYKK